MRDVLFVVAPHGQQQCAGEFLKLAENANGQPVWEQRAGNFWLYSGTNGLWIIAGRDARQQGFKCSHGLLFCPTPHAGVPPDRVKGVWERLHGENFVGDSGIVVSAKQRPVPALRVVSPNGQQCCTGDYVLTEMFAHGMPVWQHQSSECYLYCGSNSSWIFGGADAKEKDFMCANGVIFSRRLSGGLMPEKVGGTWLRLTGEEFLEDGAISVSVKPQPLYIHTRNGQHKCSGEYVPLTDRTANGYPIWEHVGSRCWLYSGTNGMWIIGGTDAAAKNFVCTRGVIYCQSVHRGQMPEKMVGAWLRLDGDTFREDAAIMVSTDPLSIHVVSPNGHQRCGGEYVLVSERVREQPVWKQRKSQLRICSASDGTWVVCEGEEVLLKSEQPHGGQMPDKVPGRPWSWHNEGEMVQDDAIEVTQTTALAKPSKLTVVTPNGQQNCGGEYGLVLGEMANGHPLWKQTAGKFWLYSGSNGLWIIGGGGAKRKNFDCSRGVIYSATSHGGQLPHQVDGLWLRLHGQEFVEDGTIQVSE